MSGPKNVVSSDVDSVFQEETLTWVLEPNVLKYELIHHSEFESFLPDVLFIQVQPDEALFLGAQILPSR